jgi:hypothetical protein
MQLGDNLKLSLQRSVSRGRFVTMAMSDPDQSNLVDTLGREFISQVSQEHDRFDIAIESTPDPAQERISGNPASD